MLPLNKTGRFLNLGWESKPNKLFVTSIVMLVSEQLSLIKPAVYFL